MVLLLLLLVLVLVFLLLLSLDILGGIHELILANGILFIESKSSILKRYGFEFNCISVSNGNLGSYLNSFGCEPNAIDDSLARLDGDGCINCSSNSILLILPQLICDVLLLIVELAVKLEVVEDSEGKEGKEGKPDIVDDIEEGVAVVYVIEGGGGIEVVFSKDRVDEANDNKLDGFDGLVCQLS